MIELDDRIVAGMRDMLALRDARVGAGDRQIGWKLGFGAPAAAAALRIERPLVGFVLEGGLLEDGATADVTGWTTPMLEAEIAAHLARDVAPDASWEAVRDAIGGLSAAIELADAHPPPQDPRAILAGNIFHRHVVLGPVHEDRSTGDGVGARVLRDGEEVAAAEDATALTGELVEIVRSAAEQLGACGERLRAGEVVITGSATAPQPIAPGQLVRAELGPLGGVSVQVA